MTRSSKYTPVLLFMLIAALVLGACATPAASSTSADETATFATSDGPEAPDWTLETLDGGEFRLADHRGDVVVMFFMASWCGTCVPEARALAELHQKYKDDGLTVVAINVEPGKKVAELSRFRELANNADYVWAFDSEFTVAKLYEAKALDTTIIIDRTGRIAYTDSYPTPLETLEPEIQKWL